jgi:hypothetical protein
MQDLRSSGVHFELQTIRVFASFQNLRRQERFFYVKTKSYFLTSSSDSTGFIFANKDVSFNRNVRFPLAFVLGSIFVWARKKILDGYRQKAFHNNSVAFVFTAIVCVCVCACVQTCRLRAEH